jgi:hypothetical protein
MKIAAKILYVILALLSFPWVLRLTFEMNALTLYSGPQNLFFSVAHASESFSKLFFFLFSWSLRINLFFIIFCLLLVCIPPLHKKMHIRYKTNILCIVYPISQAVIWEYYDSWSINDAARYLLCFFGIAFTITVILLLSVDLIKWFKSASEHSDELREKS